MSASAITRNSPQAISSSQLSSYKTCPVPSKKRQHIPYKNRGTRCQWHPVQKTPTQVIQHRGTRCRWHPVQKTPAQVIQKPRDTFSEQARRDFRTHFVPKNKAVPRSSCVPSYLLENPLLIMHACTVELETPSSTAWGGGVYLQEHYPFFLKVCTIYIYVDHRHTHHERLSLILEDHGQQS